MVYDLGDRLRYWHVGASAVDRGQSGRFRPDAGRMADRDGRRAELDTALLRQPAIRN